MTLKNKITGIDYAEAVQLIPIVQSVGIGKGCGYQNAEPIGAVKNQRTEEPYIGTRASTSGKTTTSKDHGIVARGETHG